MFHTLRNAPSGSVCLEIELGWCQSLYVHKQRIPVVIHELVAIPFLWGQGFIRGSRLSAKTLKKEVLFHNKVLRKLSSFRYKKEKA
jgi:hypothetical protein